MSLVLQSRRLLTVSSSDQLKDLLSNAFDDVSSIDDEEDDNSSEFRSSELRPTTRNLVGIKKKFISTPNDNGTVLRNRPPANVSVIEEEPTSLSASREDLCTGDKGASTERGRDAEHLNESYHVQLLLDENKKLSSERTKLQLLYETVNGDFEGVSYKCQRLEEVLTEKEQLVDQLMGKLAALEMSLQAAKEAQSETCNKLLIAESTISSLRSELKEMHQADGMERIRVLYESQLKKLKETYETERSSWTDEREALKEVIDEQKQQISRAKLELSLRIKKAADRPAVNAEEQLKKREVELDLARQSNQMLEEKVKQLQATLQDLKAQSSTTKTALTLKQQECETLSQQVCDQKQQQQSREREVAELKQELRRVVEQSKALETAVAEKRVHADEAMQAHVEQRVRTQTQAFRDQMTERLQEELASRVKDIRDAYSEQLDACVTKICFWVEGLTGQGLKPQECELYTVFEPIVKIWFAIEKRLQEQLNKMVEKRREIEEAKQELEQAYMDSKSDSHEDEHEPLLDRLRLELKEAREEVGLLKDKVSKYKKSYTLQVKKFAGDREQLKQDYAALIRTQVADACREREQQVRSLLSSDSRLLLQQINQAYLDSLRDLKEQNERFFEQSNGRSLKKMGDAIVTYHEMVTQKIAQRSRLLAHQINETFCDADGGDVSLLRPALHATSH